MKFALLITISIFSFNCYSQSKIDSYPFDNEKETFGKFYISRSFDNEFETTDQKIKVKAFLIIYSGGKDNNYLYMASVWPKEKSQSYGVTYNHRAFNRKNPESGEMTSYTLFKWDYKNSYNSNVGSATVILEQVLSSYAFKMTIITDKSNMLVYEGFREINELNKK